VKYEYIVHRLSTDGSFFSAGHKSVKGVEEDVEEVEEDLGFSMAYPG